MSDFAPPRIRTRAIAAFIDNCLMSLPTFIVFLAFISTPLSSLADMADFFSRVERMQPLGWVCFVLVGASECVLVGLTGQSFGKLAMSLRVVQVDGSKAGLVRAGVVRTALFGLLWTFVPLFSLIDIVVGLARHDHRCLHDLVSGTKVVTA